MMKLVQLYSFIFLFLIVACTNQQGLKDDDDEIAIDDLTEIKERGKLIALTGTGSTSYFIYKGQALGFEYELLKMYADEHNLDLELILVKDMDDILEMLLRGEGDIAAANLTVTKERSNKVQFVENHLTTRQVLVQRLPENLRGLTADDIENSLVRNPLELAGKKIHVRKNSSFYKRLQHLAEEIGEEIEIIEASGDTDSEKLFEMVSTGEIDYTIADENIALINKNRFSNIDINTAISFEQKIAWAVHPRATILAADLNEWIAKKKKTNAYHTIKNKYFKASRTHSIRAKSDYSSLAGGRISEYDELLKKYSNQINWDWRLVASIVYHESKFQSDAESWMCAKGLMQMLPETAEKYGANDSTLLIPEYSIKAGTAYLKVLEKYWLQHIDDETERVKFTLASYNVGLGHVIDARNLADKFNKNPNLWDDNVSHFMKLKSTPEYYRDEVVKFGYCRGSEPVRYVKDILQTYGHYLNHIVE